MALFRWACGEANILAQQWTQSRAEAVRSSLIQGQPGLHNLNREFQASYSYTTCLKEEKKNKEKGRFCGGLNKNGLIGSCI